MGMDLLGAVSQSSAAVLAEVDVSRWRSISVQITSAGTACTVVYETSNDGTNWVAVLGTAPGSASAPVSSSTAAGLLVFPRTGAKFRTRVSVYGSGTVTAIIGLSRASLVNLAGVSIALSAADIEIGAVELKDGTTDNRASISAGGAVKVDGSAVTQPVSAASLPLPSGAATSALQSALNALLPASLGQKAMAASLAVVLASDQSAVPVTGTFWQATQPVSAASLPLPSGAATAAKQPTLGTAGTAAADVITVQGIASMTALKVDGSAVTQPVSGTFWQATQPVSAASLPLPALAATSTKQSDGSQKTQIVDGSGNVIGSTSNALDINIKSGNPTTIASTQSGTWNIGTVTAVTAITNALPAGSALIGRAVADASAATGGIASTVRLLSAAASTNDTNVKASAGRLYGIQGYNAAATVVFLKLYNKATTPTVGSDTPVKTLALPPLSGFAFDWPLGYSFATGIGFGLTASTGGADNSSAAVAAADILGLNIDYA